MLAADTFDELMRELPTINVVVPARAEGRKKEHAEIYSIVRLIGSIPHAIENFPLRLVKRERPDFHLQLGVRSIGIELTEAISQNAAKEAFLRSKGHGPECHFVRSASVAEPRKSSKQLIQEIEADRPVPGWEGDSVEIEWAAAIAHFVSEKVSRSFKSGFEHFAENWLLVYDNWPGVALRQDLAVSLLQSRLCSSDPWSVFSRVFVLDERTLLELSRDACHFHAVNHCAP